MAHRKGSGERRGDSALRPRRGGAGALIFCLFATILVVAVVWAVYRPIGDLYVALAGGRDILAGKLGGPDDWAFTTHGRVWFNQNWGTHLLYYLCHVAGGEVGLLVLKAIMVGALALFVVQVARRRGAPAGAALIAAGGVLLACHGYVDLRPNLVTLVLTPLLLLVLYRTSRNAHWMWAAAALIGIWANMHGGFIFALGVAGLWVACRLVPAAITSGPVSALSRSWPLAAGLVLAVLLAAFVNPFGFQNITHPLTMGGEGLWRTVSEWKPIFVSVPVSFGRTSEFFVVLGALMGIWAVRLFVDLWSPRESVSFRRVVMGLGSLGVSVVLAFLAGRVLPASGPSSKGAVLQMQIVFVAAVAVAITVVAAFLRALPALVGRRCRLQRPSGSQLGEVLFDIVLTGVVVAMAVSARRFIPLAMVVMAPLIAMELTWALGPDRRSFPSFLTAGVIVLLTVPFAHHLWLHYRSDNPTRPPATFFQRMVCIRNFPVAAAAFLDANDIGGRVLNEWRWEGYLHWRRPQLKLFIGGRAQQVYDSRALQLWRAILKGPSAAKLLKAMDVPLVVIPPASPRYAKLFEHLIAGPDAHWAVVYYHDREAVLGDANSPPVRELIGRVVDGRASYPDPGAAAISRAMCLASPVLRTDVKQIAAAFVAANAVSPSPSGYLSLGKISLRGAGEQRGIISYLHDEWRRLNQMDPRCADGIYILDSRKAVADVLSRVYRAQGRSEAAAEWAGQYKKICEETTKLAARWK